MADAGIFMELHAAVIPVSDMARSRTFYEEVIGLTPRREGPNEALVVYFTTGPTHICLYDAAAYGDRPGYDRQGTFANFRTADIDATHEHLVQAGVQCTDIGRTAQPDMAWFSFRDPDGNRIDVCQYGEDWLD